ncbi:MAG: hypothetical protein A2Y93_14210 [Chloroflexi bacterium RBG_13_68_17]|nr:MAG: hypothetical protein A2Y93_14210 [Chloroflexi bacterium RBG_13_68_17]
MTTLIRIFSENLLPILIVAATGFLLQRILSFDVRSLSRLTLYVCIPAMIFQLLYRTDVGPAEMLRMVAFAAAIVGIIALLAFLIGKALRLEPLALSGLVLATAFMNSGNYGLSLNRLAFGEAGLALASLFYVTSSLLNNSLGIFVARAGRESLGRSLVGLLRVPALYAILLAAGLRLLQWEMPLAFSRPIDLLASAAIPLMLLQLGMQLSRSVRPVRWTPLVAAALLRLIVPAILAWLLAPAFGLSGVARRAGILEASMPTALLSSIIATEFDTDADFVGNAVLLTTLLSPLTLTPLLMVLST